MTEPKHTPGPWVIDSDGCIVNSACHVIMSADMDEYDEPCIY